MGGPSERCRSLDTFPCCRWKVNGGELTRKVTKESCPETELNNTKRWMTPGGTFLREIYTRESCVHERKAGYQKLLLHKGMVTSTGDKVRCVLLDRGVLPMMHCVGAVTSIAFHTTNQPHQSSWDQTVKSSLLWAAPWETLQNFTEKKEKFGLNRLHVAKLRIESERKQCVILCSSVVWTHGKPV